MAKVKFALRALDQVLDDLPDHISRLEAAGQKVIGVDLEFSGSINIDRDGGIGADVEASANAMALAAGGVPVSVKAGAGSRWDNTGKIDWKVNFRTERALS